MKYDIFEVLEIAIFMAFVIGCLVAFVLFPFVFIAVGFVFVCIFISSYAYNSLMNSKESYDRWKTDRGYYEG